MRPTSRTSAVIKAVKHRATWVLLGCIGMGLLLGTVSLVGQGFPQQNVLRLVPRTTPTLNTSLPPVVIVKATNPPTSQVKFRNGDALQGKLVGMDSNRQVRWKNPNIRQALDVPSTNIFSIILAPERGVAGHKGDCLLRLTSGDQFLGRLVSLDDEKLLLDTWYAGQLTFPRGQVRWIRSTEGAGYVYQGPTGLDGWTISASADLADEKAPAWGYSRGVFFARKSGGIARDLKLPDRAAIDLDVTWKQFLQLTITIYTESLQVYRLGSMILGVMPAQINQPVAGAPNNTQPGGGFYALHLNQTLGGAYLMTVRKNGEVGNTSVEPIPGLERYQAPDQKARAMRVSIRADKIQKTISLLLDGKLIKTWQEAGDWAGQGTAVRFVQQGLAPLNISHLSVGPWDGILDKVEGAAAVGTNDFIQLKNQDAFSAGLVDIRNGALGVKTDFGLMKVPFERVTELDFARKNMQQPLEPGPGAIRAYFADHDGSVTFQVENWTEDKVVARSPIFGKAEFKPGAFSMLEFEPQKSRNP